MGYAIVTMNGMNAAYENIYKHDIFNGIVLPEGIDRDTLIDRIMIRAGEFSVRHTDIDYLHAEILNFFLIHNRTFDKWVKALALEYDPIENYNRYEEYEGSGNNSGTSQSNGSDRSTETNTRAAFNSSGYEPYEKSEVSGSSNIGGTNTGNYDDAHTSHVHGNIGVTTSQQMLQSELDLARFNIFTEISNLFVDEFCIMVY